MAEKAFDLVVFGATGFTGERVVKYLATSGLQECVCGWLAG